ncbi:MAG TPA: hypothetical protein VD927_07440 [Chryseosolibacter sp.]|nr:hypothetical protein [Chryseosolibacter sp.]
MTTKNLLFLVASLQFLSCEPQQKADNSYDTSVKNPFFIDTHPRILFDEAHYNIHTSTGTYSPFVNLITNDGCIVKPNNEPFANHVLDGFDILVISNAKGGDHNFKYRPAFTESESNIVRDWVNNGGSLLLIADHYPMGSAAENLAQKFGVHMFNGETADSVHYIGDAGFRDQLVFSRDNNLLIDNEITAGVTAVVSDRGQSLSIPDSAVVLLKLSETSYHSLPDSVWDIGETTYTRFQDPVPAVGNCQGLALRFGKGRVVVLGEASMITAQKYGDEQFGMNVPGYDNRQLALNIIHWLAAGIP